MVKTNKINILRYAKIQTIVAGLAGVIAGLTYSIGGSFYDLIFTGSLNRGSALAYFAIPVMPLYFATVGFFTAVAGAFLYNFSLRWWNGVNLKIKE